MGWEYSYYCKRLGVTFKQGDKFIVKGVAYTNSGQTSPVGYNYTNEPTEKVFYGVYSNPDHPESVAYPIHFMNDAGSRQYYIADDSIYANVSGTLDTYTYSFNANGGENAPSSKKKTFGYSFTFPTTKPIRTGYTFAGWYNNSVNNGTVYAAGKEVSGLPDKNVVWYAKWNVNKYVLTVNPNGGTWNDSTETKTFEQAYATTKSISNPTRVGYTFDGWRLSGYGEIEDGVYTYGAGAGILTAVWTRISLIVKFDATTNGGSPNSEKTVYYGDTVGTLPIPSKSFYKFMGWFTKTEGGTKISASQVITSNVTYYAQFKIDASIKLKDGGEKKPAIVWCKVNGVWKKCVTWVKKNGKWYKSTGAD